jgi:hypothetical protein
VATVPSPITTKSSTPHILHLWPLIIVTRGYPLSSTYRMESVVLTEQRMSALYTVANSIYLSTTPSCARMQRKKSWWSVSLKRQALNCSKKLTVVPAAIRPPHEPWSVKLSGQDSTGRLPWPMQRSWYATAMGASFFAKHIYVPAHEIQTILAS